MTTKRKLAEVQDPQGRVDVAIYRICDRLMERLETEQGIFGLRDKVLPVIENAILQNIPAENMIPQEIQALLEMCRLNRKQA